MRVVFVKLSDQRHIVSVERSDGTVVELQFDSPTQMTFTIKDGAGLATNNYTETVTTTMTEVRPNVFVTSWQEQSGATVTHVEDFENETLISNATLPDGQFVQMTGTIIPLDLGEDADRSHAKKATRYHSDERALRPRRPLRTRPVLEGTVRSTLTEHADRTGHAAQCVPQLVGFQWSPQRIVAEDDLVIAHSRVLGWGPDPLVIADIFRIEDQRIVEHWDVVQSEVSASESANGNPMV